jgi:hypothetical protein
VVCPTSPVATTKTAVRSTGSSCFFNPSLVLATDADSGVAIIVFADASAGTTIGTWTVSEWDRCSFCSCLCMA